MGLSANNWNAARAIARGTGDTINTRSGVPADSGIVLAKYNIDAADDEQSPILAYQPVWLYYPSDTIGLNIQDSQRVMSVLSSDRIGRFGSGDQIGESPEWVTIGVSRQQLLPGEIGSFVVSGRTVARCYDQRLTDDPIHQHLSLNYWAFMTDIYQYRQTDPLTVAIENGKFTPYIPDAGSSTPIRARLIWRNITLETTTDSDNYDPDSCDYGIVILPVFFQFPET